MASVSASGTPPQQLMKQALFTLAAISCVHATAVTAAASADSALPAGRPTVIMGYIQKKPDNAYIVVPPLSGFANTTGFGAVGVLDQPFTATANETSAKIATLKGFSAFVNREAGEGAGIEIVVTFIFSEGSGYGEGSTLNFQGHRNIPAVPPAGQAVVNVAGQEISICGGTGKFRLARGWGTFQDVYRAPDNGRAITKFTAFVYL